MGRWLFGQAAGWLDLAGVSRLLDYAPLDDQNCIAYRSFLAAMGFAELTRTERGWILRHEPDGAGRPAVRRDGPAVS